jgi:ferric-dicitrate binding protein FerR (iron transport regulator)
MPNKTVNKIINLYTRFQPKEDQARNKFHEWLVDEESADEKEKALFDLWERNGNAAESAKREAFEALAAVQPQPSGTKKATVRFCFRHYAAMLASAVAGALLFYLLQPAATLPDGNSLNECFTPEGEIKNISLPDGSTVCANSGTLLLYPASFGKKTRTVYLLGEANFKIIENKKTPFIVKTERFSVVAAGTEFDVSSYPEDTRFKATLINGVIKVVPDNKPDCYTLSVGNRFVYDKKNEEHTVENIDIRDATAWQRGELVFRGATIKEIMEVLERHFAVSFQYRQDIFDNNTDRYSFRFKENVPLEEILRIIKTVANKFYYEKIDDSYHISIAE